VLFGLIVVFSLVQISSLDVTSLFILFCPDILRGASVGKFLFKVQPSKEGVYSRFTDPIKLRCDSDPKSD